MSVNLSGLLVLLIGVPLLLVAGGLLLNAYLMVRRSHVETADRALEALATESMDELLLELQRAIEEIKSQLARQRVTLSGLLTEAGAYAQPAGETPQRDETLFSRPGQPPAPARPQPAEQPPAPPDIDTRVDPPAAADLRGAVDQLVAEGLSDRSIARRMRIGVEEVRLARLRSGRAS